jgi:hypothetical protein
VATFAFDRLAGLVAVTVLAVLRSAFGSTERGSGVSGS